MRFIATVSFSTGRSFDAKKDDPEVNRVLEAIQRAGAKILQIQVTLAGQEAGATSLYVIEYEAEAPIAVPR
jgi:hypothetical protein